METPLLEAVLTSPAFWSFALGAVVAICSCVTWTSVARHKHRPEEIRAETELFRAKYEEARYDRAQEGQLAFISQITRGLKAELDGQLSAVPAPRDSEARAQEEKKAA